MRAKQILSTLRKLTLLAQKQEDERKREERGLAKSRANAKVLEEGVYTSDNAKLITKFVITLIILQATEDACKKRRYTSAYDIRRIRDKPEVMERILQKLRGLGFGAEIICGQGHGKWKSETCKSIYAKRRCWPELHISWGADSIGWRAKRKRPD